MELSTGHKVVFKGSFKIGDRLKLIKKIGIADVYGTGAMFGRLIEKEDEIFAFICEEIKDGDNIVSDKVKFFNELPIEDFNKIHTVIDKVISDLIFPKAEGV